MSSVNVIGLGEVQAKLNGLSAEVLEEVDIEVQDAAKLWEQLAKELAPVDTGFLRGNILGAPAGFLNAEVVSPVFYSPYQEWGTGDSKNIPDDLIAYAAQFRRGSKKRKGIPPANGDGFFFKHKPEVQEVLFGNINKILNTEH